MRIIRWIMSLIGIKTSELMLFGFLPLPLSKEDEQPYLEQMQNGDEIAREKLVEHNLGMVARVVCKYELQYENRDDLMSIGSIGLIKAIKTYDPEHGIVLVFPHRAVAREDQPPPSADGAPFVREGGRGTMESTSRHALLAVLAITMQHCGAMWASRPTKKHPSPCFFPSGRRPPNSPFSSLNSPLKTLLTPSG